MRQSLRPVYNRQLERAEVRVIEAKAGRISAVVSTETRDRDGDIIRVAGWNLDNFMRNPVMLDSHRYGSLEAVIGRWDSMEVKGKKLIGEATYRIGRGQQNADIAFDIAKEGGAAFSVGFLPDMSKAKELEGGEDWWPHYEFNGQELLEVSQVSVPSNPDALQRMKGIHPLIDEMIAERLENLDMIDSKLVELHVLALAERIAKIEESLEPLFAHQPQMPFYKPTQELLDDHIIDYAQLFQQAAQEALNHD